MKTLGFDYGKRFRGAGMRIFYFWTIFCFSLMSAEAVEPPVATVKNGRLQGTLENGLEVFRAIPYAAPPVGSLRWRAPREARDWEGIRKAEKFGCSCMQSDQPERPVKIEKSEDCLTLNIWTPRKSGEPMPVMVWIHGGAFRFGTSATPFYDGSALAKHGVVVVTINYRIGRPGFFAHPLLSEDRNQNYPEEPLANYGLMDQIFALQWVQKNIQAFGGNPEKVTIFGESAGGSSVFYLSTSPKSTGLFSGAIVESGGGFQNPPSIDKGRGPNKSLTQQGLDWSSRLGSPVKTVDDLRKVPAEQIIGTGEPIALGFGPVIDGDIIVDDIATRFETGKIQPACYLIGGNSYEGSLMKMTKTPPETMLNSLGKERDSILKLYSQAGIEDEEDSALTAFGDALFLAPARYLAEVATQQGARVWLYHFDYVPTVLRLIRPGTVHGGEIPFVFGVLDQLPLGRWLSTDEDKVMSDSVMAYWVAFAKYGEPRPEAGNYPPWPAFDLKDKPTQVFTRQGVRAENGFLEDRLKFYIHRYKNLTSGAALTDDGHP